MNGPYSLLLPDERAIHLGSRSRFLWRERGKSQNVKGDRVEIVVDTGDGTRTYEVAATRAGRRVEVSTGRGIVEVSEVTRTGTAVRTARFMASRVVALVEHPADTSAAD
jgi:hypothetical protein